MVRVFLAVAVAATGVACTDDAPAAPARHSDRVTTSLANEGRLDGLTLTLEVKKTLLAPGEQTSSQLTIENGTKQVITDPACWLPAYRFGLIPADDPSADLEYAHVVDCGGSFGFKPGYSDTWTGPDFRAAFIRESEPLPPGDYLAALEIRGFSERLSVPVVVRD